MNCQHQSRHVTKRSTTNHEHIKHTEQKTVKISRKHSTKLQN